MSGKPKEGFDWAKWDTHVDDDPQLDELIDAQGWLGFSVYYYLSQKASANGYYYRWSYANAATTARKMGGGMRSETVKATVGSCCKIGLFDKRLLECEGILTGIRIQRMYVDGVSKGNRSYRTVEKRYWILGEQETVAGRIKFFESNLPDVGDSYAENSDALIEHADVLIEHGPKEKNRTEENRSIESVRACKEDDGFTRFWAAYPSKQNFEEAYKTFLTVEHPPVDVLIEAIERQKHSRRWQEAYGKYIPAPARWLRSKGWLNQDPEVQPAREPISDTRRERRKTASFWDIAEQMKRGGEV